MESQRQRSQALGQQEIERGKRLVEWAYATTPQEYHNYIVVLDRNKRLPDRSYVSVQSPYMGADGRVKMATFDALQHNSPITIETEFFRVEEQVMCRAIVTTHAGRVTAHARAFMDGAGPHATNPLEVAETSAVARALGFLGYGLFGGGMASAEEMEAALTEQEKTAPVKADTSRLTHDEPKSDKPQESIKDESRRMMRDFKNACDPGVLDKICWMIYGVKQFSDMAKIKDSRFEECINFLRYIHDEARAREDTGWRTDVEKANVFLTECDKVYTESRGTIMIQRYIAAACDLLEGDDLDKDQKEALSQALATWQDYASKGNIPPDRMGDLIADAKRWVG